MLSAGDWARRAGRAAVVLAYVATDPAAAARSWWDVLRRFREDGR